MAAGQHAISQNNFGLKAGMNVSDQHKTITTRLNPSSQTEKTKLLPGYQFGAFYKIKINPTWTVSTEVNFSVLGSRTHYVTEQQILNPDGIEHYYHDKSGYIEIPVSVQYRFRHFYMGAGPGIAFKVFSKITNLETKSYRTPYYKTIDASGNFLIGYTLSKKLDINFRYSYGLLNIHQEPGFVKTKNRSLSISVLYSLKYK